MILWRPPLKILIYLIYITLLFLSTIMCIVHDEQWNECSKKQCNAMYTAALCVKCILVCSMLPFTFLQVTNPPIDPIREKIVMSLVRQCYFVTQCMLYIFFPGSTMEEN